MQNFNFLTSLGSSADKAEPNSVANPGERFFGNDAHIIFIRCYSKTRDCYKAVHYKAEINIM